MAARNLTEYFQDKKPTLEYELKGKTIIGDVSTLKILQCTSLYSQKEMIENEDKMTVALFNIIFGKENATYLIDNLTSAGFLVVAQEVTEAINGEAAGTEGGDKSPSETK